MADSLFARVDEVQALHGVSRTEAYRIIISLNEELKKQGYIVVNDQGNRQYLMEKIYGCCDKKKPIG